MKSILMVAFIAGLTVTCGALYLAWQHNPQCEYHCEGVIHWSNLLPLGLSWFAVTFAGLLVVALPLWLAGKRRQ
ncbi:hypothetical protein [Marinobacter mobilis]|uniref:Uncharacterized protein n=1 Tax=Marinobacter mobilis TaxID=488533 RepID=A0A1H3C5Y6_9GAMM|nr:hypothetical protein [Marinobacter mobilis]SDX01231.1 hypothetical protein SAMN04487960_105291 [Marinobacter mobilis]SDX48909.1 hypothetical protein SAMN04487960_11021 [Marinobacter mobilis]